MNISNKINRSPTNKSLLRSSLSFDQVIRIQSISDQRARNAETETYMQDQNAVA